MSDYKDQLQCNAYLNDLLARWFFPYIDQPLEILDFGCGQGLLTHFMQRSFFKARVRGIDSNDGQIQENQKEYPDLTFIHYEGIYLPFEDATFDLIYMVNVMHHIACDERKQTIHGLKRILKPNGVLIIFEFNPLNWFAVQKFKKDHEASIGMIYARSLQKLLNQSSLATKVTYLYPRLSEGRLCALEPYFGYVPWGPLYVLTCNKLKEHSGIQKS